MRVVFWSIVILLGILILICLTVYFVEKHKYVEEQRLICCIAYDRWCEAEERGDKEMQELFAKMTIERIRHLQSLVRKKDRPAMDFIIESIQNER